MNVESNIYVAHHTATNYLIYELYNPSSTRGGVLHKTEAGYFKNASKYLIKNIDDGKFWKRRNLTGVTFSTPIVVRLFYVYCACCDFIFNAASRTVLNSSGRLHTK